MSGSNFDEIYQIIIGKMLKEKYFRNVHWVHVDEEVNEIQEKIQLEKSDYEALIDIALLLKDREWFLELTEKV